MRARPLSVVTIRAIRLANRLPSAVADEPGERRQCCPVRLARAVVRAAPAAAIGCRPWPSADDTHKIALARGEPLDFLVYVSTLLAAVDPRGQNPFERERAGGPERATLPTLIESFAEVALPETTALLAALAELGPDELTRARAARALATRPHPLPPWLARLGKASVYRAVESTHVLGDGDSVLLGARLPGSELTAVIYIDHNLGTVVKDVTSASPTRERGFRRRSRSARSLSRHLRPRPGRPRGH